MAKTVDRLESQARDRPTKQKKINIHRRKNNSTQRRARGKRKDEMRETIFSFCFELQQLQIALGIGGSLVNCSECRSLGEVWVSLRKWGEKDMSYSGLRFYLGGNRKWGGPWQA